MGTIDKKKQVREARQRPVSDVQSKAVARMRTALGRVEWIQKNRSKKPHTDVSTLVRKENKNGRPTLVHNTAAKGTFYGDLKETYKFGPNFNNKDRRDRTRAKTSDDFVKKSEARKGREVARKRVIQRIVEWVKNLFKRNRNEK